MEEQQEKEKEKKEKVEEKEGEQASELKGEKEKVTELKKRTQIDIPKFIISKGKVSDIMVLFNFIQTKFNKLEIKINASEGIIKESEYEDKIKEAFKQLVIDIK